MKVRSAAYAEYGSVDELRTILSDSTLPRPFLFVGGCSNFLFTGDFPGTVVHSAMREVHTLSDDGKTVLVEAGAGLVFDDFVAKMSSEGLWGVENLSHIPGEVGAGAVQNVGAYGVEAKDVIERVNCLEISSGKQVSFQRSECGYGYRASNFKGPWKGQYAVTSVVFSLSRTPAPHLDYGHLRAAVEAQTTKGEPLTPSAIREVVTMIRRGKLPEPEELGSAGSFFKNPVITPEHFEKILSEYRSSEAGAEASVPHYDVIQEGSPAVKVPAAWLIEQCGWKGRRMGGAACYEKQPLVIVNLSGEATPSEILSLESAIIDSVNRKFGITLHPEVEHI